MSKSRMIQFLLMALVIFSAPREAFAYIGPGAGIGAIGAVIAIIVAVFLAILAFIWYPIKRLLAKFKKPNKEKSS